ncbi:MAG TPA: undecaprenyl-diphosphate phosphatase [Methanothrix sp.]|nr:undecaprenyl-diphosphate phosphatase [Methanothrix sp.]HPJ84004.1 undecaprenyl-diphosphate phosphatase [Methanothrix sp.]HPR65536.1 undecaprenyl-diphosphate phosphatase [Methanothrix sp.]
MQTLQALLLGILQGVTEWLPISSEGQTLLMMISWLGMSPEAAFSYSIFLHLGTMTAVVVKFRHQFLEVLRDLNSNLAKTVIVSTIFTGVFGLPLYFLVRDAFTDGRTATFIIGSLLIANGLLLKSQRSGTKGLDSITTRDMIILGLAQGLAILPGVSRSGTTITVLLMRKVRQDLSLSLSFMISVPAVLGAVILDHSYSAIPLKTSISMFFASFVAGYLTMGLLVRFAQKIDFYKFCIALGVFTITATAIM